MRQIASPRFLGFLVTTLLACIVEWGCRTYRDPIRPLAWIHGYTLVWSDEFNGPDGSPPDPKKWAYDTGGKGWGNQERECYTNRLQNARIQGGNLVITAQ